jgi:hypothetical protein
MSIQSQIQCLKDWLKFDLETVYITGSALTFIVESNYKLPAWTPSDIDICCYDISNEHYEQLTDFLKSKSKKWETITTQEGLEILYCYIPDFVKVSIQKTKMHYKTRMIWADYSVCSLFGDGDRIEMHENTLHDIEHNILRRTGPYRQKPGCIESILYERYYNYINKGYIDHNNQVISGIENFLKD